MIGLARVVIGGAMMVRLAVRTPDATSSSNGPQRVVSLRAY